MSPDAPRLNFLSIIQYFYTYCKVGNGSKQLPAYFLMVVRHIEASDFLCRMVILCAVGFRIFVGHFSETAEVLSQQALF